MTNRSTAPTRRTQAPRRRGDETRAKIIDETVRCILEEGFGAATAKHVAERAGVTWGVIQYHFGDRNGLLMAVVSDGVARLIERLSGARVADLPNRRRLETVIDIAWECYSSPTSMAALEILQATRGGDPQHRHLAEMNTATQALGRLISDDPADHPVAEVIWAALRGMVLAQLIVGQPLDWRAERATLTEMAARTLAGGQ